MTGRSGENSKSENANVALVPLGTPLLAGPGAIVATMLFVQEATTTPYVIGLIVAVVAVHVVIALALLSSTTILRVIREAGVTLVARIAGLLLAAIAVQMIVDSIRGFISA